MRLDELGQGFIIRLIMRSIKTDTRRIRFFVLTDALSTIVRLDVLCVRVYKDDTQTHYASG